MRVLIFGDSITQGFWDTDGGWVERIRMHYDSLQITDLNGRDEPTVFNLGVCGDNSARVLARIQPETLARTWLKQKPVVVIQVGINDSSTDSLPINESVHVPIDAYEQNLWEIVHLTQPLCSQIIFVGLTACDEPLTTPVAWGDYKYTNKAIKRYEDGMRDVAANMGIEFIPVFERFMARLHAGEDLLSDGLHPNNEGHRVLSELIMESLKPLLESVRQ